MANFIVPIENTDAVEFTTEMTTAGYNIQFFGDYPFVSEYVKVGNLVHFSISVNFSNVTNFGNGPYFLAAPFQSAQNYIFRGGNLIQSGQFYEISASLVAGQNYMGLFYSEKDANDVIRNFPMTSTEPVTLATSSSLYISGSYIATS